MLPGGRIVKTMIAVSISLIVSRYLLNLSGFYMTVAVILSMKSDPEKSKEYSKNRVIGTFIGGVLGYIVLTLLKETPITEDSIWMLIVNIMSVFLLLWFSKIIKLAESGAAIGCVVFFSITLIRFDQPIADYVALRVFETLAGVLISMIVNSINIRQKRI